MSNTGMILARGLSPAMDNEVMSEGSADQPAQGSELDGAAAGSSSSAAALAGQVAQLQMAAAAAAAEGQEGEADAPPPLEVEPGAAAPQAEESAEAGDGETEEAEAAELRKLQEAMEEEIERSGASMRGKYNIAVIRFKVSQLLCFVLSCVNATLVILLAWSQTACLRLCRDGHAVPDHFAKAYTTLRRTK
jgi:hypothetical protein